MIYVQAFGDAQAGFSEKEKQELLKAALKKATERLKKGQRALQHLQPPGHSINIINTVAVPNVSRQYLRRVLLDDPDLNQVGLAAEMVTSIS